MCNVSRVWPARLLAAVTALALVVACVIGAYAHATGHSLPVAEYTAAVVGTDDPASHSHAPIVEAAALEPGHVGHTHDGEGTGHGHLDCCDTICHGGQAILAADALELPPPHSRPVIGLVAAFDGAEPGGLDRPPKAIRSA